MTLHMEAQGKGRPVVWLHAFPFSSAMWAGELAAFSGSHRGLAPDFPGFGRSPRMAPWTMAEAARAVFGTLDALGVSEPVVLGGLSMGGYVAFECVRAFPNRIRALMLAATKPGADSAEGREGRMKSIASIRASGMEPFARMFLQKCLGETTRARRPGVVERVRAMVMAAEAESAMAGLQGLADRRDSRDLLAGIRCPTLILAGEEDALIPVAEHQAMQEGIPGSSLRVIPAAGHMINLEAPEAFRAAVRKFLDGAAEPPFS